jgi:nucleoside-diphosphate-sugar epimerase
MARDAERRILVTGATGLIGCHSVAALVRRGFVVRALVRDPAKLEQVLAPLEVSAERVEAVRGDVTRASSLVDAVEGCDALVHAAGLFSHELADAQALEDVNVRGTENVLGAAARGGLDPIVHVSSFLALLPPCGERLGADDPISAPRAMYARTKAASDRVARDLQQEGAPVVIVYPASVQGPHDPTVGSGPGVFAEMLRRGRVLVTSGGLAYTDVRDLALLIALLQAPGRGPRRILASADFVDHARFHRLLSDLTGRELGIDRMPAPLLRLIGVAGDLVQRLTGRRAQLTSEAAMVLTRSVPFDDAEARALLGDALHPVEQSFRDLLVWMYHAGVLQAEHVGRLAAENDDLAKGVPGAYL